MRGRPALRMIRLRPWDPSMVRGVLLALFFLTGALLGYFYARSCHMAEPEALSLYLRDFCAAYDAGSVTVSLASCAVLYLSYTALAFLLGFASIGAALIPLLSGAFGFFTMYTISCFVLTYGRGGVLLALAALVVRLLFCVPCFFAVAGEAWPLSTALAMLALGRGKRSAPVLYGSRYFLLFVLCVVILTVGICCERFLTPLLFRLALGTVI